MKARYLIYSIGALAVFVAGWMLRSPTADAASASSPVANTAPAAAQVPAVIVPAATAPTPTAPVQVAAPKVAPAAPPVQSAPLADNQKELGTALAELLRYAQSGDLVTAWQLYAQPDHFAEIPLERRAQVDDHLRAAATDPQIQLRVQVLTQVLDSFSTQTPSYNDAGDVATFQVSGPATAVGLKTVHFKKVDGRWYVANDDLDNIGRLLGL